MQRGFGGIPFLILVGVGIIVFIIGYIFLGRMLNLSLPFVRDYVSAEEMREWDDRSKPVVRLSTITAPNRKEVIPVLKVTNGPAVGCGGEKLEGSDRKDNNSLTFELKIQRAQTGRNCMLIADDGYKVKLDPEWIKSGDRSFFVEIGGGKDEYLLDYHPENFELEVKEVKSEMTIVDKYAKAKLLPPEVWTIALSGKVDEKYDYTEDLELYAKARGYRLAREVYPGLEVDPSEYLVEAIYVINDGQSDFSNTSQELKDFSHEGVTVSLFKRIGSDDQLSEFSF